MEYFDKTEKNYFGVLKITNPRTLDMWKKTGKYQELLNDGYIYAVGCGRFIKEACVCCKCKIKQVTN
jgi:hypothetical protein